LTHIIEQQAWESGVQPGDADRLSPEMPHVGIERFRPGHRQHHRPQRQKGKLGINQEKMHGPIGVDDADDRGMATEIDHPQNGQNQKVKGHDRTE